MRRSFFTSIMGALLAVFADFAAHAEPTDIVVRVLGRDAKFIGSSMGGMRVTLRDALTGEIFATGTTQRGTGDTRRLMHTNGERQHGRRPHAPHCERRWRP